MISVVATGSSRLNPCISARTLAISAWLRLLSAFFSPCTCLTMPSMASSSSIAAFTGWPKPLPTWRANRPYPAAFRPIVPAIAPADFIPPSAAASRSKAAFCLTAVADTCSILFFNSCCPSARLRVSTPLLRRAAAFSRILPACLIKLSRSLCPCICRRDSSRSCVRVAVPLLRISSRSACCCRWLSRNACLVSANFFFKPG